MPKYNVTASWMVEAESSEEALNFIENAVAADGRLVTELDDSSIEEEE